MATTASVGGILTRQARIIAIPLARPRLRPLLPLSSVKDDKPIPATGHQRVLTYYQFQLSQPTPKTAAATVEGQAKEREAKAVAEGGEGGTKPTGWIPEEGVVVWAQTKGSQLWTSFGKAEGGWKLKIFQTGERLMDKLDFEELALKSVDPSMAPSLTHPTRNTLSEKGGAIPSKIPLLYPPSITPNGSAVLDQLKRDTAHRTPTHRRGFYTWLIIAPFTAPFMIIPIIPNLPFFFCVWRSWSHYKAWRSSQYLQSLLDKDLIVPEASEALDSVYTTPSPSPSPASSSSSSSTSPSTPDTPQPNDAGYELLLTKSSIPTLLARFELRPSTSADVYRAVEQARLRVKNGSI